MTEEKNFLNNFFNLISVKTVTIDNKGIISDYLTVPEEDRAFMEKIASDYIFKDDTGIFTKIHFQKTAFNTDLKNVFEISVSLNDALVPGKYLFSLIELKNVNSYIDDIYSCPLGKFKKGYKMLTNNIWYEVISITPWEKPLHEVHYADYGLKPLILPTIIQNVTKVEDLRKLSKYAKDEVSKAVLENKLKKLENHTTLEELNFLELPLKRKVEIYLDDLSNNNKSTKEKRELKSKLFEIFDDLVNKKG